MKNSFVLFVLLAMTLLLTVNAQIASECSELFTTTVNTLYENDASCVTTLTDLTDDTITAACTTEKKTDIRTCIQKYTSEWEDFMTNCTELTTLVAPEVPSTSTEEPSSPPTESVPEPSTAAPIPAAEPIPAAAPSMEEVSGDESSQASLTDGPSSEGAPSTMEETETQGSQEDVSFLDNLDSAPAPGPESSRRLYRRLLTSDTENKITEHAFVKTDALEITRRLLSETAELTCHELFTQTGFSAFDAPAPSPTNGASNSNISLLSIIGSILLGLMLI